MDFVEYRAKRQAACKFIYGPTIAKFHCLLCGHRWEAETPEGMKKTNCPMCEATLIHFKPKGN